MSQVIMTHKLSHIVIQGVDPVAVVAGVKQQQNVRVALSNSFGFGGHNSCVMFRALSQ